MPLEGEGIICLLPGENRNELIKRALKSLFNMEADCYLSLGNCFPLQVNCRIFLLQMKKLSI